MIDIFPNISLPSYLIAKRRQHDSRIHTPSYTHRSSSSQTSNPPLLNLRQSPTPTNKSHNPNHHRSRQRLSQIPTLVIQEENPFHSQHTPEK